MRRAGIAALLAVGTLIFIGFGVGVWAERQVLDTDEWVDTSADLLENEPVRTALGLFIVDRLFDSEEVQAQIEEVLPPRLDPLAGPAAAGLKEVARRNVPRLPPGAVDRLPPEVASLQIASGEDLRTAQDALDLVKTLVWVLLGLALVSFAGAIALSRDGRRTILNVGGCLMFAAIAVLAVRRLAGETVVEALADAPNAMGAADDAWDISTSLLVDVAQGSFLFGLFIVTGGWLAGAGRGATAGPRPPAFAMREHPG